MTSDQSTHTPQRSTSNSRSSLPPATARRPLPNPTDYQPNSPTVVPTSSFYASPSGSKSSLSQANTGSAHTAYIPPTSPPPPTRRESSPLANIHESKVVIVEESEQDKLPSYSGDEPRDYSGWETTNTPWDHFTPSSNNNTWPLGSGVWDSIATRKIEIDNRNEDEEENWWDAEVRAKHKRPGPGVLPPLLSDMLHNPEHTLYHVQATPPPPRHTHSASASIAASSSSSPPPQAFVPPSAEEVRMAIPHPHAYYCKDENGWFLLSWFPSSVLPRFVPSFIPEHPLPDSARRKRTVSCVVDEDQPFGRSNKTHHFHRYKRAVNASSLSVPYKRSDWEVDGGRNRRSQPSSAAKDALEEEDAHLLDFYVCCQCSVSCLVSSEVIPGVIPNRLMIDFENDKLSNPALGRTPKATLILGWETVLTIIENRLWKGETRVLPVTRTKFRSKLGWNETIHQIFASLGFSLTHSTTLGEEDALKPPNIELTTPEGRRMKAKLLRAWVEISTWLMLTGKSKTSLGDFVPQNLNVSAESAREMYQSGIGAHVTQIPRGELPPQLTHYETILSLWPKLGMTPNSYSSELLLFAYFASCRCDPANTMVYFDALCSIHETLTLLSGAGSGSSASNRDDVDVIIAEERSRGRFTSNDLRSAIQTLGFGKDNELGVDLDEEVDDQFILDAWKNALKRAYRMEIHGNENGAGVAGMDFSASDKARERRVAVNDAFKIIAEYRGSARLRKAWDEERGSGMSVESAFSSLGIPKDLDESMILAIYSMRVTDQPNELSKMKEALAVIAEVLDSDRLRQFLISGMDPGDATHATSMDMPRGLNQLGNTCYLNSLLQYFYTIKDLREAVAPLANANAKLLDDSKFSDDDLKKHRVGGRLVTRREILRSKKFVSQLAGLFYNLEFCETSSVTPTIDLAKLALVTSQDEEEDQTGTATDSSNDTDATLVEDAPLRTMASPGLDDRSSQSPVLGYAPSGSVLGKRYRERDRNDNMDVDSPAPASSSDLEKDKDMENYVIVSKPSSPRMSPSPSPDTDPVPSSSSTTSSSMSKMKTVEQPPEDTDVEMQDASNPSSKPPPLPPRKQRVDDSVMMFGRQHDVSECMDNCMFQIETALLDFEDDVGAEDDKTSVVKRLFYGKKRQRLTPLDQPDPRRQMTMHEKEDLFSHLHVNVSEEGYDLYDGLSRYFDDVVEFETVKKRMEVSVIDLPPLLQIQLQRVQFDRETQQAYKSQAFVKFGEKLFLDRFLDSAKPAKKARSEAIQSQLSTSRDRIQRLMQGKHAPFAPALGSTADFLSKQNILDFPEVDDSLVSALHSEQQLLTSTLDTERANIVKLKAELEELWANDQEAAYELTSVFVHRGSSPSFGHYFFYSRHLPDKPDSWFKYNDSDVSVVTKDEVLADTTGSTANPYMLVFARRGSEIIETVKRFDPASIEEDLL